MPPKRQRGGEPAGGGRGRGLARARAAREEPREEADGEGDAFDESDEERRPPPGQEEEEEAEAETAAEKRLRLAKAYLSNLRTELAADKASKRTTLSEDEAEEGEEEEEGEGEGEEGLAGRLRRDAKQARGEQQRVLARRLAVPRPGGGAGALWRGHKAPVTALALSSDDAFAISASKAGELFRWDVETGQRSRLPQTPPAPTATGPCAPPRSGAAAVLALALSSDGRLLASGGADRHVRLWDLRACAQGGPACHSAAFPGHRDALLALAFRPASHALLSASADRSLKLWDADELAYSDTLFGHSAEVAALAVGRRERAVTCGPDRSCRLWKLGEDSQLVFQAPPLAGGLDCVAWASANEWVTGARDGSLMRWSALKKKPAGVWAAAHGPPPPPAAAAQPAAEAAAAPGAARRAGGAGLGAHGSLAARSVAAARAAAGCAPGLGDAGRWVASLAQAAGSDLLASGGADGCVRLWRCGAGEFGFEPRGGLPVRGFVNALALASSGRFLLAGVGQEPRLGRWARDGGAENGVVLHRLALKEEAAAAAAAAEEEERE